MRVIINEKEEFPVPEGARNLMNVLETLLEYLSSKDLGLIKLRVNEQEVPPGKSLSAVQNMDISNIHIIEVTAVPTLQLLRESIVELEKYTPELSNLCYGIAELFQSENPADALGPFQKLTEIWGEIKNREALIVNTISKYVEGENPIISDIIEHHNELNQYLNEAYKALDREDIISLSDILQYELAPRAEKEIEILNLLKKLVENIEVIDSN
ncbi:MAG: hypothetical protein N3G21_12185 [Candidatus Hydrogenedentes bacterium]|nr:hypothetical protein [Candidatus Hydrogenedentota bacterium]